MQNKILKKLGIVTYVFALVFLMSACSSGNPEKTDSIKTGVFLDSAVEGVKYITSSGLDGFTNKKGEYKFKNGDTVEFLVGDVSLGKTSAQDIITVFDLEYPIKVAQFLQTFDEDALADNGIKITKKTFNAFITKSGQNALSTMQASLASDFKISDFDAQSTKTIELVDKIVKIAVLDDRKAVDEYYAVYHANAALIEQNLVKNQSEFIKYLRGNKNFYAYNGSPYNLTTNAKSRVYLYSYYYFIEPLVQIEHESFKNNITQIDELKTVIEKLEIATSAIKDIHTLSKASTISDSITAVNGLVSSGQDILVNTLLSDDDEATALYAGYSAMKSCAMGAATELNLGSCIAEGLKSVQTLGFSTLVNVTTEQDQEIEVANIFMKEYLACGEDLSCVSDKYLDGEPFSYKKVINKIIGDTSIFTNDPDYEDVMQYIYKFVNISNAFMDDIERIVGDLNKYDTDFVIQPFLKADLSKLVIKEYGDTNADLIYKLNIYDKGARVHIENVKISLGGHLLKELNDIQLKSREILDLSLSSDIIDWSSIKTVDSSKLSLEILFSNPNDTSKHLTYKITKDLDINYIKSELDSSIENFNVWLEKSTIEGIENQSVYFKAFESGRVDLPDSEEPYTELIIKQVEGPSVSIHEEDTFEYTFVAPSVPQDKEFLNLVFKITAIDHNTNVIANAKYLHVKVYKDGNVVPDSDDSALEVEFIPSSFTAQADTNYTIEAYIYHEYRMSDLNFTWSVEPNNDDMILTSKGNTNSISMKFKHNYTAYDKKFRITLNVEGPNENLDDDTASSYIDVFVKKEQKNTIPTASSQALTVGQNSSNNAITLVGSDADSDTLTYTLLSQPSHGTLSGTAPNFSYTPASDYTGTDSFTFSVNDGTADSDVATVSINVQDYSSIVALPAAKSEELGSRYVQLPEFGSVVSSYMNIDAYANYATLEGNSTVDYQCTELIKRFYASVFNIKRDTTGDGRDVAQTYNSEKGTYGTQPIILEYHANGSSYEPPVNGSIISLDRSDLKYGHVAIAKKVECTDENSCTAYLFEQNWIYTDGDGVSWIGHSRKAIFNKDENGIWSGYDDSSNRVDVVGWTIAKADGPVLPQITLIDVATVEQNEDVHFEATVSQALDSIYTIKIRLGDGGGGYLDPVDMNSSETRTSFTYTTPISVAGERVYEVGLFEDDVQKGGWIDGTYTIRESNATTTQQSIIKKTGQTKSYDENGTEVTDGSLRDDGYYQKGVTPDYTRASDIVTDELTGLMWQDDAAVASVTKQWLTDDNYNTCKNDTSSPACYDTSGDTAATYCSELSLGGYTDWRLPTSTELEGIVDYGKYGPAIDTTYFNNVSSSYYWSSTTYEDGKYNAWGVYFSYGSVNRNRKGNNNYVRCVRDGQ